MRTLLTKDQPLVSVTGLSRTRTFVIRDVLGEGASCVAYRAVDADSKLLVVIKECLPLNARGRDENCAVIWPSQDVEAQAKTRFRAAFEIQREIQNDYKTMETGVHLIDNLFTAKNTLYTVSNSHNAMTYGEITDSSLQEIFKTARGVARAIGQYHKLGFLHLDIKPENILVQSDRHDIIWLMDYDSVVRKTDAACPGVPLSFTEKYAAPELQQAHKRKAVCEATDIYSIGAVVFDRIMGRVPIDEDRGQFADWDFDGNFLFDKLSNKAKRLTKELFNTTLSSYIGDRCPSTEALIKKLDELIKESEPGKRHLLCTYTPSANFLIGSRRKELSQISDAFASGRRAVFLHGMHGFGKTELAMGYAAQYGIHYDVIAFGKFEDSLLRLFESDKFISIANNNEGGTDINAIRGLVDDRTLLIIDNFDTEAEPELDDVLSLKCHLLFTSCHSFEEAYGNDAHYRHIPVGSLPISEQAALFERDYGRKLNKDEREAVLDILEEIGGFTLLIPLIAKACINDDYTIAEMRQRIIDAGIKGASDVNVQHRKDALISGSAYAILCEVLKMAKLNDREVHVMRSLALLGNIVVDRKEFNAWLGDKYKNDVLSLSKKSWVQCQDAARLSLHRVIGDTVRNVLDANVLNCPEIQEMIRGKTEKFSESQKGIDDFCKLKTTMLPVHSYEHYSLIGLIRTAFKYSNLSDKTIGDFWIDVIYNIVDSLTVRFYDGKEAFQKFLLLYVEADDVSRRPDNRLFEAYTALMTYGLCGNLANRSVVALAKVAKEQADSRAALQGLTEEQLGDLYLRICMPLFQRIQVLQEDQFTQDFWVHVPEYKDIYVFIKRLWGEALSKLGRGRNDVKQVFKAFVEQTSPKGMAEAQYAKLAYEAWKNGIREDLAVNPGSLQNRLGISEEGGVADWWGDALEYCPDDKLAICKAESIIHELSEIIGSIAWVLSHSSLLENEKAEIEQSVKNNADRIYQLDTFGAVYNPTCAYYDFSSENQVIGLKLEEMEGLFSCCYAILGDIPKCREHLKRLLAYHKVAPLRFAKCFSYENVLISSLLSADLALEYYEGIVGLLCSGDAAYDRQYDAYEKALELAQNAKNAEKTVFYKAKIADLTGIRFSTD